MRRPPRDPGPDTLSTGDGSGRARRDLPSLSALEAFEATARHLSVKRAAAELAVTPTAVSHQLRRLEEALELRLLERAPRRILLTREGQLLYPVLRDGFDAFARALRDVRIAEPKAITISATTAFTARWLLPRVASFRKRSPELSLNLHASEDAVDLREGVVDVAIRYGRPSGPALVAELLFEDTFAPVCSPRLGVRKPSDLRRQTLLHFEWKHPGRRTPTWARWFARAAKGARGAKAMAPGLSFSEESHAIAATIAGEGVGLLSSALVKDEIDRGTLVSPFGPRLRGSGYYLAYLASAARSPAVRAVKAWILEEAARA